MEIVTIFQPKVYMYYIFQPNFGILLLLQGATGNLRFFASIKN